MVGNSVDLWLLPHFRNAMLLKDAYPHVECAFRNQNVENNDRWQDYQTQEERNQI